MDIEIMAILYIASLVINGYLVHRMAKNDGYINPIGVFSAFLFLMGTLILGLVLLIDYLNEYYKKP